MTLPPTSPSVCSRCGSQVSPTALFCRACGQALTDEMRRFCSTCGKPAALGARFCKQCGQGLSRPQQAAAKAPPAIPRGTFPGAPLPPAATVRSKPRSPVMWLAGCAVLVTFGLLATGGYFGYRYWSSLSGGPGSAGGDALTEVDADWDSRDVAPPDLTQAQAQIEPHVARLAEAARSGNVEQVASMTLVETGTELRSAFAGHPERLERFGRLLGTRRLKAVEGDLAEFEVTEDGRVFVLTFQRVGNTWALHSF